MTVNTSIPILAALALALCGCAAPRATTSSVAEADAPPCAWLAGDWEGEGFGGHIDESWMPPRAGEMLGMFRLVVDGRTRFSEVFSVGRGADGEWEMRLRHFHPDMTGWEERDAPLVWPAVHVDAARAAFGPVVFERVGDDRLRVSVTHGAEQSTRFELRRRGT